MPIILRETRELSGKLPEYRVIDDAEVRLTIPAAAQEHSPARAVITVRSAGRPLPGADLLALYPNATWQRGTTDENGEAAVDLHTTHLPLTVFAAAPGHAAHLEREWLPSQGALALELHAIAGGSVIFPEAAGAVPGIEGRLNPIRDAFDRTYLYAANVAINRGKPQPVNFIPGEGLLLTDARGHDCVVRIIAIVGRAALVEYRPYPARDDI